MNAKGTAWVAFGRGSEIHVARSDDGGATFATPVRVASLPSLMLGRRRGPRIVAHGDHLTVTAMAADLQAFTSTDGGRTWKGPFRVNDTAGSAREAAKQFPALGQPEILRPAGSSWPRFLGRQNLLNIMGQIAVIAIVAVGFGSILSSAVFVESVFSRPGIGTLITDDGLSEANHRMLTDAGIRVIVARPNTDFS